jgi:methylenetetrahydrofolate reductase (NADPH)
LSETLVPQTAPREAGSLRPLLADPARFVRVIELTTMRGALASSRADRAAAMAGELSAGNLADAFGITDGPSGEAKVGPEALGLRLLADDRRVVVHQTCRDLNRAALTSRAWTLASLGFANVLALSGDYPADAYRGLAAPVYDLDSVGLISLLRSLEAESRVPVTGRGPQPTPLTLCVGAAVSPFKYREDELVPQYQKMDMKVRAGAEFIVTQTGYDVRKWDELARRARATGASTPIFANVFVLTAGAARYFNRGEVPGVYLSDDLLAVVERQVASPDKGKAFFRAFAAMQVAVARGLGFRGVYIGGHLTAEDVSRVIEQADSYGPEYARDWRELAAELQYPPAGGFYLHAPDASSGLSCDTPSAERVESLVPEAGKRPRAAFDYQVNRAVHALAFADEAPLFGVARRIYGTVDKHGRLGAVLHGVEQLAKVPMYGCRDCGDCSLPEIAYLCPQSQCAKNQRNGPCGGSHDGQCEVLPQQCVWVRAHNRLRPYGEAETMLDRKPTITDERLRGTSSWANRFLDRDHCRQDG